MIAIYKRETASMLRSMIGWVVIAVLLGIAGIYFTNGNLNYGLPYFGYVLSSVSFFLVFLCPALTMRTFAEEKRQKTDQLLLTAPVSVGSIVMGKYLALLTVFAIPTGIFALYPLILGQYGAVPMAETYATLLAFFLLGAACLAVGMFFSSITEHQVVAFVTAVVVLVVSYLMTGLQTIITAGSGSALVLFSVLAAAIGGLLLYFQELCAGRGRFHGGRAGAGGGHRHPQQRCDQRVYQCSGFAGAVRPVQRVFERHAGSGSLSLPDLGGGAVRLFHGAGAGEAPLELRRCPDETV